jgi:hypothetical protein
VADVGGSSFVFYKCSFFTWGMFAVLGSITIFVVAERVIEEIALK